MRAAVYQSVYANELAADVGSGCSDSVGIWSSILCGAGPGKALCQRQAVCQFSAIVPNLDTPAAALTCGCYWERTQNVPARNTANSRKPVKKCKYGNVKI